jgi:glycosyltransferase involved in cell wall biosynthesis
VDTQRFKPNSPPTLNLRQRLGISPGSPVVACVAHLLPVKGHPTLIQAVSQLPAAHLLLAGKPMDQEYEHSLQAQVSALNLAQRVHLLGDISEIPALLAETDIFVLPTWARWRMEGCPVALLEAMACGKACIATDIPGARDLIQPGQSGLLVPPEDADAITAAIRLLAKDVDLQGRLGRAARARVEAHFTIEQEVARHTALYAQILGQDG